MIVDSQYFPFIEEMEWAIEVAKNYGKPVAATMCIGPISDKKGVSSGECAVRMCKAGLSNHSHSNNVHAYRGREEILKLYYKCCLDVYAVIQFFVLHA